MNEDSYWNDVGEITFDDMQAFLRACGADFPCPVCSFDRWAISDPKEAGLGDVNLRDSHGRPRGRVLANVVVYCHRCGFVRLHHAQQVTRWINAGKPAEWRPE